MTEDFLAYIWKFQYFNKENLRTAGNEELVVLKPGNLNTNAGPDFQQASIRINDIVWVGSVEFHVKASNWQRHAHTTDGKYDQVILHVVWENDATVLRTDQTPVPVLALKELVSPNLLQTYQNLKKAKAAIPCEAFLPTVPAITKTFMLERVLLERLEEKAQRIREIYRHSGNNWEETLYKIMLVGFGFKINQNGFSKLAQALPFKILQKHQYESLQTEALLFGQAGFLAENHTDPYLLQLRREYLFLKHKYDLPPALQPSDWNFLRLRPANFPTVRLSQLAVLISARPHWFSTLTGNLRLKELEAFFKVNPSGYWQKHYMPEREANFKIGALGKSSVHLLLINVVAPLLVAYAREMDQPALVEKALHLLEALPPEKNHILEAFQQMGFENKSAAQSQGLLSLGQNYCQPVHCLQCAIGNSILKRSKTAA
ncbi:DUF2851 family protein [Adhaeribacter soli]|uniref:DUF2851 family protein n=1 Tax=Adhaeribacter soli TaxID=2607655 RepID=A0A5N1J1H7_9BACT|nr:DUF2851 family protein [Adhaeribacter soli]KAA9340598.1 DUF2851 family protein [Adhaeribacter soli]